MVTGGLNHRRLAKLEGVHRELVARAAAHGIPSDPDGTIGKTRIPRRERRDLEAEARQTAADFIRYAMEMETVGQEPDTATRQRMMLQMESVMALKGGQLEVLVAELLVADGLGDRARRDLIEFSLRRLTTDYPQDALSILMDSPGLDELMNRNSPGRFASKVSSALGRWAALRPEAAVDWYREHRERFSEAELQRVEGGLTYGMAASDLRMALTLHREFKGDLRSIPYIAVAGRKTPEDRVAALGPVREWCAVLDEKQREGVFVDSMAKLLMKAKSVDEPADFDTVMRGIEAANLRADEVALLTRPDLIDLSYYIQSEDAGRWVGWLGERFSAEVSSRRISQLASDHRTKKAVAEWLAIAPDSPGKTEAVLAYLQSNASRDPESATPWVLALPVGDERSRALDTIHEAMPRHDATAVDAAAAFAEEHGLDR